ncbi:chondroitin proteoglycan 2-like [Battus philenor]|uniref:chondroitin proteoglycan 2-like n=1 Tax=Battus philenor TaxID=42288 RepID=UPI0035CF315A
MEVLHVVVLLLAAAAANAEVNFCPKIQEVDWEIELLLPHRECNKFYQCAHGELVEMPCPEGLFFNIFDQRCDWRDNVDCCDRIVPDDSTSENGESVTAIRNNPAIVNENNITDEKIAEPMKPERIEFLSNGCPVDPSIHWLLPNEQFCNLFYYCVKGERELRRCPFLLHFNRKLQVCDWPQNAGFLQAVVFLLVAAVASAELNFCPKIQEVDWEIERLLPHRECNKFYQCTHGEPVEMSCPKGLFFSIIEQRCDWRDNVDCWDRIILDEWATESVGGSAIESTAATNEGESSTTEKIKETTQSDAPIIEFYLNGCPVDPEVHWLLPHEKFCNLFYYCVQGEREIRRCPFWLHFNRLLQVCDWPKEAGCIVGEE